MKSFGTIVPMFTFFIILSVLYPTVKVLEAGERVHAFMRARMKKERA